MVISKIKGAFALLTGGLAGIIKYFLTVFNTQVLARIPNKEAGVKYIKDIQAVYALIKTIMENHSADISDKRKECLGKILAALEELNKAIEDFTVSEDELEVIIEKVKEAIDAWKKSK